jgi:DNA-binding beta-propeller fold protein YncE
VEPINLITQTAGTPISIPGGDTPLAIAITHDGRTAYVTNTTFTQNYPGTTTGAVVPINLATNTPGNPIPFSGAVSAIAIAPDDQTAFIINDKSDVGTIAIFVVPITLRTGTGGTPIPFSGGAGDIAITRDGRTAYVTQRQFVVPINLLNLTLEPRIQLPTGADAVHIVVIG